MRLTGASGAMHIRTPEHRYGQARRRWTAYAARMHLLLLLACTAPDQATDASPRDTAVADSGAPPDSGDSGADDSGTDLDTALSYNGVPPDSPVPLPDFSARNLDGAARGPADLRGHATVLWFYPAAGTYG
jgi:hypothetical protein